MNDQIKFVKKLDFDFETDNPIEIMKTLASYEDTFLRCARNHATTTSASATSQVLTMIVFVEGSSGKTSILIGQLRVRFVLLFHFNIMHIQGSLKCMF